LLDNRGLVDSSSLGPGGINTNAISECEDVLITLVLEGIWVNIDDTFGIGNAGGNKLLMRLARRINNTSEEVLLNNLTWVDVAESGDLLSILVVSNLGHFPSEEDLDSSLLAFLESNLVGIGELIDLLVGSPELDAGILGGTSLKNILAKEVLVVKSIEIRALSLIGESRWVADHVTVSVVPSVIVVVINSFLVINSVNEDVAEGIVGEFGETFNVFNLMLETSCQHKCLICILSAIAKLQLVLVGLELGYLGECVHARPGLDLGRDSCALKFKFSDVTVGNTKIWLRQHKARSLSYEGHLVVNSVALQELDKCSRVHATYEYNVEIGVGSRHVRLLLGTTTSEGSLVHGGHRGKSRLSSSWLLKEMGSALWKHIFESLY